MAEEITVQSVIARSGPALARVVSGNPKFAGQVNASFVRRSVNCLAFSMTAGERRALVKVFDPESADWQAACKREIECQQALRATGLVPPILGHSQKDGLVITSWQEGATLADTMMPARAAHWAEAQGRWYRAFCNAMPGKPLGGTWADYLARYTEQDLGAVFAPHAELLSGMPIRRQVIARNDSHMSNFMVDPAGRLMGIDFESASLKPAGWDVLLTARILQINAPDRQAEWLPALLRGWGHQPGELPDAQFSELAALFARLTAPLDLDNRQPVGS